VNLKILSRKKTLPLSLKAEKRLLVKKEKTFLFHSAKTLSLAKADKQEPCVDAASACVAKTESARAAKQSNLPSHRF